MILSIISLLALFFSGVFAGLYALYKRKTKSVIDVPRIVLILGIVLVVVFGMILTPVFTFKLEDALERAKWPSVDGKIVSSTVIGGRAFRPDIEYDYEVGGKIYHGSSSLNVPGFGGRMNRLDAAEKLVHLYTAGTSITVHYNPEQPGQSTLTPNPSYSLYLKLGTSILLYIIGFSIIFINGFKPKKKPLYKERK